MCEYIAKFCRVKIFLHIIVVCHLFLNFVFVRVICIYLINKNMDSQIYPITINSLPQVVVTPSPTSVQTETVESLVRKIESIAEVAGNGAPSEPVKQSVEEAAATPGPSASLSSGEFVPAQECNECIVQMPEVSPAQQLETVSEATPEPEPDEFRTEDMECCTRCGIQCIEYYEKAWHMVHSKYAVPFWLLLLALPISGGYIGALYMYSCPASHSLPMLKFTIGVSLMAVLSFRICLIIRRMTTTPEEDEWRDMLHTLLLISTFLTIVFFITESMAFWKMAPTTHPGTQYCDPNFVTYSFWWNCIMSVAMVPIFLFPA